MIKKRGQVALFVVIGVVVLILAMLLYFTRGEDSQIYLGQIDTRPYDSYMSSCVDMLAKQSVHLIGKQGGYFMLPFEYEEAGIDIPIYFWEGIDIMPGISFIESELERYISNNIVVCYDGAKEILPAGYALEEFGAETDVVIADDGVRFEVRPNAVIKHENSAGQMRDISADIFPLRLRSMHRLAELVVQDNVDEPDYICMSCLVDWAEEYDVRFVLNKTYSRFFEFTVIDDYADIYDEHYQFRFSGKVRDPNDGQEEAE